MPSMSTVAVGGNITASNENTEIGWINSMGLIGINPTSASGTGVAKGTNGVVTFTAATAISINGCFTSTYDQYLIVLDVASVSTTLQINARLRLAGTDASGATDYGTQVLFSSGTTTSSFAPVGSSSAQVGAASAGRIYAKIDVFSPALARKTGFDASSIGPASVTSVGLIRLGATHELTVAYDGISLIPSTGNATGSVRVYAYNNL